MRIKLMIYLAVFYSILLCVFTLKSQVAMQKILLEYKILDTLKVNNTSVEFKVLWLKDTLLVRSSKGIDIAMDSIVGNIIKNKKDPEYKPSEKKLVNMKKFLATSFQNCYSFALEKYFLENERYYQTLFTQDIWLQDGMEKILSKSFRRVTHFKAKPRRFIMRFMPDKVILAFRDKEGVLLHTLYYNEGVYYSKNGAFKIVEYKSLKDALRGSYKDTDIVEVYKFDIR